MSRSRVIMLKSKVVMSSSRALCCSPSVKKQKTWLPFFSFNVCNCNRTEWSPIRSVIIRVITKSDEREAGVRFVHHEYEYRPTWTARSAIFEKRIAKLWKKGKLRFKIPTKEMESLLQVIRHQKHKSKHAHARTRVITTANVIGLLNCPITKCPITNCPITAWLVN